MSRGGLIAYNFAASYPERVSCIYADAPVCDFKSWPGGVGVAHRRDAEWQQCLDAYGLDETRGLAYLGNPIDHLAPLAAARIPLLAPAWAETGLQPGDHETLPDRLRARGYRTLHIGKAHFGGQGTAGADSRSSGFCERRGKSQRSIRTLRRDAIFRRH